MGRRADFENVARTGRALREGIGNFRSTYVPSFMTDITDYRQRLGSQFGEVYGGLRDEFSRARPEEELLKSTWSGMITDPSKRGYTREGEQRMYGVASDQVTGARRSAMEDINRRVAASGMGNTGIGMRYAQDIGRDYATQHRQAMRDVALQAEEARRADLTSAMSSLADLQRSMDTRNLQNLQLQGGTLGTQYGLEQGALGQISNTLDQVLKSYGLEDDALRTQIMSLAEKNQPGFWRTFLNSLGKSLGESIGSP